MSLYNLDPRPEYARATLIWSGGTDNLPIACCTGNQISSRLLSCKNATALLMLPGRTVERTTLQPGDIVEAMMFGYTH